ncbi:ATP-dependent helicase [Roseibium denhamense]|uniref:SNF2 family N-terminal domain-containing protein n=1 Tax=Roseibium denhamense TaxID=76305 RepID=A0ABY1PGN6_9HYPH|nr:DISARM system SNF2-like helicase DrmD [Roseibium denhamense]MTI04979.1 ATP-dependent helicase [Roseibium denhamense]SMP33337.1 SNF2 family N-terminal domain-containing protein [Roseibium denhamense]
MTTESYPQIGDFVSVRGRNWLVEDVEAGETGPTVARLACVEDDAQGEAVTVVWSSEIAPEIETDEIWKSIAKNGSDGADTFSAYLRTVKWGSATSADRRLLQAPFRAGIRMDAYQLAPLYKALSLPRVNLLIADDVGLGKTVEAGLIVREMLLRRRIDFVLVSAPPSMLQQWKDELAVKFGLAATIIDRDYLGHVRRTRGFLSNPWATGSFFILSHRLLTDETYVAGLREMLGNTRAKSLFVLDEAHHAAPSSGSRYAIDSQLTRSVNELSKRFEHRLFLTATPHNGHSNSFTALLEMLDPQRFTRGVKVRPKDLEPVMVRRLKGDLRALGETFPERLVEPIKIENISTDAPELRLDQMLADYGELRGRRIAKLGRRAQVEAMLVFSGLQQRLLSSVAAFEKTLNVHLRSLQRYKEENAKAYGSMGQAFVSGSGVVDEFDELETEEQLANLIEEDEEAAAEAATLVGAGGASLDEIQAEIDAVNAMLEVAGPAGQRPDQKVHWIAQWVEQNLLNGAEWNDRRLIIFTEYEDTRRWLQARLSELLDSYDCEDRIAALTGATALDQRELLKYAFNADPSEEPLRILICTDAAREGINLQHRCYDLIHFDLPWNPSRLEQRNGRIDRKLQPAPTVYCRYFLYAQRESDIVLDALVRKTDRIRRELGAVGKVIEDRMMERLISEGIGKGRGQALVEALNSDEDNEVISRALREMEESEGEKRQDRLKNEIDRLRAVLEESRRKVGVDPGDLERAIQISLSRIGIPFQAEADGSGCTVDTYSLDPQAPAFAHDRSWADVFDELRDRPRKRGESLNDWRRNTEPRRLSFEPPVLADGRDASHVAQLHLEHRLVRRLLARFKSQGFRSDLERACVLVGPGAMPRVVLLGRLSMYGPNASRLHEELIPVVAQWREADRGKKPLTALAEKGERAHLTLEELEEALAHGHPASEHVVERLLSFAQQDVVALRPTLEERAILRAADVTKDLVKIGDAEATSLRKLLSEQRDRIANLANDPKQAQLTMEFDAAEKRQADSDRRHWSVRLSELDQEIKTEPNRARNSYDVKARRIEPIGLVYLWPVSG